jgi:thymidylate kinase
MASANLQSKETLNLKIVILGPDGAGKSSVIDGLMHRLNSLRLAVKMRHLKPRIVAKLRNQAEIIVVDPHGKPPRGTFLSLVKLFVWIFEEWYANFFSEKRGTLLICDRYYHDLLVDPKRYRFGAPLWTARLVGMLMPQPKLWILLNAPAEVLQVRKQEVAPEETARQCEAYIKFIRTRRSHAIIDASQPLDKVIMDVEQVIADVLVEHEGSRE